MKRTLALEALRHCIVCLLVILSSAAVKGQPRLSDPLLLPGNLSLAPSAGDQSTAQIARGDDGYLIVWTDTRTVFATLARTFAGGPFTEPGLGTMRDIYAALLDSEGNIVRSFPLATTGIDYDQHFPALAWNGRHWLVCWLSIQQDNRFLTEIVGVRVAPDGTVIDTTPIRIQSGMDLSVHPLWVASDGTNWLVAWFELCVGHAHCLGAARGARRNSARCFPTHAIERIDNLLRSRRLYQRDLSGRDKRQHDRSCHTPEC
jgi:hypothetical protein